MRQFLDIGSGLATHEAARAVIPDAMVAYVDYDPVAVLHS
jgi:S-adenosyl methyltransferase